MIAIYDSKGMAKVLAGDLDAKLHDLLSQHKAALISPWGDLTDSTIFLIIQSGDSEDAIVREIGFSPLVDALAGLRFEHPAFTPPWDNLTVRGGWYEMVVTFGSTFSYILLIADEEGVLPALRLMCRQHCYTSF